MSSSPSSNITTTVAATAQPICHTNTAAFKKLTKSITNNIFSKTIHPFRRKCYKCINSKTYLDFPIDDLEELNSTIFAYNSGPDTGIEEIDSPISALATCSTDNENFESFSLIGLDKWSKYHHRAYGISCTLYETNPVTTQTIGEPIADTYAILARQNNTILLMADGVNWGIKSRRASRCAVRAAMNYINKYLFLNTDQQYVKTTHDVFKIMSKAFDEAQEFIIKKNATMTTLCCSIVTKLASESSLYVVCTLSVGDSTAYVFTSKDKKVFELTKGSRNVFNERDIRNVGGALGYVYGTKPDLTNLNYSVMYIKENDIVFLMSDGISDNFDPCVSGVARKKDSNSTNGHNDEKNVSLPFMDPYERYLCSLTHLNEVILRNKTLNDTISAQEVCVMLIDHVIKLTDEKRKLLENGFVHLASLKSDEEKYKFQKKLREDVQNLHGKLDHASVVAFEV